MLNGARSADVFQFLVSWVAVVRDSHNLDELIWQASGYPVSAWMSCI